MKIGILTDSTSGLTKEFIKENNIKVAHLTLLNGGNIYIDGLDITHEEINILLENGESFTTSQPTTDTLIKLYEEFKNEGYDKVLAIHMSGSLSGTMQNSKIAAEIAGMDAVVIDSLSGSYALRKMVEKASVLLNEGHSIEAAQDAVLKIRNERRTITVPYSLKQLEKSGRASAAQVLFTNMLSIKIILELSNQDGTLKVIDKIRTEKKVLKKLELMLEEASQDRKILEVGLMHVANEDLINSWKVQLESKFPNIQFEISNFTPVVGIHSGIGTIAISF